MIHYISALHISGFRIGRGTLSYCGSNHVGRHGYSQEGIKRYLCKNITCSHSTFMLDYIYHAYQSEVRGQKIERKHLTLQSSVL